MDGCILEKRKKMKKKKKEKRNEGLKFVDLI